jgi:hypothetical protein
MLETIVVYETGSTTIIYLYILASLFDFYVSFILALYIDFLSFLFRRIFVYLEEIMGNIFK